MTKIETKISVTGVDVIKDLFDVLAENYDQLPESVKRSLEALTNGESLSWDSDWLADHGYDGMRASVFVDGNKLEHVKCLYPFRKVVAFYDENNVMREIKVEHAQIKLDDGYIIREW